MYESLLYETKDGIATITLNRPERGNVFSTNSFLEIMQVFESCDLDKDVQVVIITGNGKNFSLGGDVQAMTAEGYISYETAKKTSAMSGAVKKCVKPVIAAVNGVAAGAGCGLALACDFRIMTENSALMTAFLNIGLTCDTGCAYHLFQIVGLAKTMELMLLGTPVKGDEALLLGLATKVVPEPQLLETAYSLAERLKSKPQLALFNQKKLLYDYYYRDYGAYCEMEARLFDDTGKSADHMEAVIAFLEKRHPVFKGR